MQSARAPGILRRLEKHGTLETPEKLGKRGALETPEKLGKRGALKTPEKPMIRGVLKTPEKPGKREALKTPEKPGKLETLRKRRKRKTRGKWPSRARRVPRRLAWTRPAHLRAAPTLNETDRE